MRSAVITLSTVALFLARCVEPAADGALGSRHLIYLHGRIVQEQQSARPRHLRFGEYQLEKILVAFRGRGFVVSGEIRPRSASVGESADRVVDEVRNLLESGVPPERITVIGASMGAGIALVAAARLQNPDVRFCLLGACPAESVRAVQAEEGKVPAGKMLFIREASDESTRPCPSWRNDPAWASSLSAREIVLDTSSATGFSTAPYRNG